MGWPCGRCSPDIRSPSPPCRDTGSSRPSLARRPTWAPWQSGQPSRRRRLHQSRPWEEPTVPLRSTISKKSGPELQDWQTLKTQGKFRNLDHEFLKVWVWPIILNLLRSEPTLAARLQTSLDRIEVILMWFKWLLMISLMIWVQEVCKNLFTVYTVELLFSRGWTEVALSFIKFFRIFGNCCLYFRFRFTNFKDSLLYSFFIHSKRRSAKRFLWGGFSSKLVRHIGQDTKTPMQSPQIMLSQVWQQKIYKKVNSWLWLKVGIFSRRINYLFWSFKADWTISLWHKRWICLDWICVSWSVFSWIFRILLS